MRDHFPDPRELQWAKDRNFDYYGHSYNLDPLDDLTDYTELGPDEPNQVGDTVLYGQQDGTPGFHYGGPDISNVEHSGVVHQVDSQGNAMVIRSKWGNRHLTDHNPADAPAIYGTKRIYYRHKPPPHGI